MDYPYTAVATEGFLLREDNLPWFSIAPQRTRNVFVMHCLSGQARVLRNFEPFVFQKDMEWILLFDCMVSIEQPTPDFRVRYCVCSPSFFDEVTHSLSSNFYDFIAEEGPFQMQADIDFEANRLYFGMMQLVFSNRQNIHRHQIAVNTLQNYFLDIHNADLKRIDEAGQKYNDAADRLVKRFWKLVSVHYKEHHEVQWYADQLCVCTRHLSQVVRSKTGLTPKQSIDDYIALEIKIELRTTHDSVQQIADRLHFSDQSAMGRFFHHKTGLTPTQYRNSIALGQAL